MQHAGQSLTLFFNVGDVPADSAAALSDTLSSKAALQHLQLSLGGEHPSASASGAYALQPGHVDCSDVLLDVQMQLLAICMLHATPTHGLPVSTAGVGTAKLHMPPSTSFTGQR
jgi:hypothetical protein